MINDGTSSNAQPVKAKKTSLRLSPSVHTDLKKACIDLGVSMSDALDEAARDWLAKKDADIKAARKAAKKGGRA